LSEGVADGAIISPFFTPRQPRARNPSASQLAEEIRAEGGEAIFDATTHGALLPGVNEWSYYNTWELWDGPRGDLSTEGLRAEHLGRVFAHQVDLEIMRLAPTLALDSAGGADSDVAAALAEEAARMEPGVAQSIAGRRGFWLSEDLDQFIGVLAQNRPNRWFVTLIRESTDYPPGDVYANELAALCRTVDSLSRRAEVIVCHADLFGLPAVAAGATGVGTGWHTRQRVCAPATFQQNDPDQIRRQAVWLTYEGLVSRLHSQQSDLLVQRARALAERLYRGPVSNVGRAARVHHLGALGELIDLVSSAGSRTASVTLLSDLYTAAGDQLDSFAHSYIRTFAQTRVDYIDQPLDALRAYAEGEGISL